MKTTITGKEALRKINTMTESGKSIKDSAQEIFNTFTVTNMKTGAPYPKPSLLAAAAYGVGWRKREYARKTRAAKKQGGGAREAHSDHRIVQGFLSECNGDSRLAA